MARWWSMTSLSGRFSLQMFFYVSVGDTVTSHGPIAESETSVRTEPYSLPRGFSWDTLDLTDCAVVRHKTTSIKVFLGENLNILLLL